MSAANPARQPWLRRLFGDRAEGAAEQYLRRLGYRVLARNYCCPLGELDLVARDGSVVVFVEVRSTSGDDPERPALSVDGTKQSKLTKTAVHYLKKHKLLDCTARFDVLALHWPAGQTEPSIQHFKGAFEAADY